MGNEKMKTIKYILPLIAISLFNCEKAEVIPKMNYNVKANELIQQIISEDSCDCFLEIPKESMIQIAEAERPGMDIRKKLIKNLDLNNQDNLDSLSNLSNNFILDKDKLKHKKLKWIKLDTLTSYVKNGKSPFKICPIGILCIEKPIFNKSYTIAAVGLNPALICSSGFVAFYRFKNGKWIPK